MLHNIPSESYYYYLKVLFRYKIHADETIILNRTYQQGDECCGAANKKYIAMQ